jgi:hypothetical protein
MFQAKDIDKIKTHILYPIKFFCESRTVHELMWKKFYSRAGQSEIRDMHIACWILKATTHSHNIQYLLLFHCNNGCMNAPQNYVIRTLSVLL